MLLLSGRKNLSSSAPPPPPTSPRPEISVAAANPLPSPDGSAAVSFHWRSVETNDLRRYISNLQLMGCPDRTIRAIVLAEVEKLFWAKTLEHVRPYADPWQNELRRLGRKAQPQRARALSAEKLALLRELLGPETPDVVNEDMMGIFEATGIVGYLPEKKSKQIISLIDRYAQETQELRDDADNILLDEDRDRMAEMEKGFKDKLFSLLDPAEFEELACRAQLEAGPPGVHLDGVEMTGAELRQLCQLSRSVTDVLRDPWEPWEDRMRESPEKEQRGKEFQGKVAALLGEGRRTDLERAQDPKFRETYSFTRDHDLPKAKAVSLFEARLAIEEQAKELKADRSLSSDERETALLVLNDAAVQRLSTLLGPEAAKSYFENRSDWLEQLMPKKTETPEAGR